MAVLALVYRLIKGSRITHQEYDDNIQFLDEKIDGLHVNVDVLVKTANYTAVSGDVIFVDTSGGSFTITLPATWTKNDWIVIKDYKGSCAAFPLTVARNGSNIGGAAEDMTISTDYLGLRMTAIDAAIGWAPS